MKILEKNIILVTILSLAFVFGMFSRPSATVCTNDTDCGKGQMCAVKSGNSGCYSAADVFHCLVRNNPNDCKVFVVENKTDFLAAVSACNNQATDPNNGGLADGRCPGSSATTPAADVGPLAGASVDELKSQAGSVLNKANFSGPTDLISRAIKILLAFIGSISLVLYIYSGFLWMTDSGNT